MVNPLKGEVELKAGDATHTLRLGTNALIEIQTVLGGIDPSQLGQRMIDPGTKGETIRAVLWGALGGSRSGLSLFDVGDLIDAYPAEVGKAIGEVFMLSMPEPKGTPKQNPRKPPAGTGKKSSQGGSRSPATPKRRSGR